MQFRILGALELISPERQTRIAGARQQRLLALLLLHTNQTVSVSRLIEQLWDDPPSSARQQVHNAVGTLRRTLSDHAAGAAVTWTEAGYRLEVPEELVDAHVFSALVGEGRRAAAAGDLPAAITLLQSALDLWRGEALTGLIGPVIESAAARLNEERLATEEELMSLRLMNGETSSLISRLQQLVTEHPLRESLHITLMRTLHLSGRRTEALEVYQTARRLLAEELGLDPSPSLQQMHAEVLNGQPEAPARTAPNEIGSSTTDTAAVPESGKFYLPHDTGDFSGRSAELLTLLGDARSTSPTALAISAVDGMGGVGKTALAIHFGHQVAGEYPNGHYFIDLRGFSRGVEPVTAEQALDALLRDSGLPPELIPSTLEAKSAAWRSRVAGQRILLILDNAADAAQVRPMLPGSAGALVLVTSRRKLSALEGAQAVSLDVLPHEDAVALFEKVVGAERTRGEKEAVASAVELCGRLPLAIRIAAARLRDRTSWSVTDLVGRLADHTQRLRLLRLDDRCVMTALKLSYRYLTPQQQLVFRTLSLHPGGEFDAYVAAALSDIRVADAEDCLDALFECNLLKQNSSGRYYFHDLVQDCARLLLDEATGDAERDDALRRMFDYYLHLAHTLSAGLHNVIHDVPPQVDRVPERFRQADKATDAIGVLNEEYANLVAVAQLAIDGEWHRQAWQLACSLQPYLEVRNYSGVSYALFEGGVRAARAIGDIRGESACLRCLAAVCRYLRSTDEAKQHLERSLELTRKLDDPRSETAQLVQLGNLYLYEDKLEEAREIYLRAQPLSSIDPTGFLSAGIAVNLGSIDGDLGDYDQALTSLREALTMMTEHSPASVLYTMWRIGTVLHHRGDHDQAVDEFTRALHSSRNYKIQRSEALALVGLAGVHRSLGEFAQSLDEGRQALTLAQKYDLRATECEALNTIGETTIALQDVDRAEQVFAQALERASQHGLVRYRARADEGFAHVALLRGKLDDARLHWRAAFDAYPRGMADARYAAQHLTSLHTTCFRCETANGPTGAVQEHVPSRNGSALGKDGSIPVP